MTRQPPAPEPGQKPVGVPTRPAWTSAPGPAPKPERAPAGSPDRKPVGAAPGRAPSALAVRGPATNRRPRPAEPPNPLGLLIVATAALIAVILTFGVFLPALGALTGGGADAPAATANVVTGLPSRISVCGRDWERGEATRALTAAEVFARDEREPIVVDTGLFAACPAEVEAADGPVLVVYVQAGPDAFVPYSLAEGS